MLAGSRQTVDLRTVANVEHQVVRASRLRTAISTIRSEVMPWPGSAVYALDMLADRLATAERFVEGVVWC